MINYSISKRLVKGKEDEGTKRVYAYAQSDLFMSIEQFAEHISSHGSLYSEDIVEGVLKKAVKCMVEKLKEGYKIDLGALGMFYVTIINKGWQELPENLKDFNPAIHISGLNVGTMGQAHQHWRRRGVQPGGKPQGTVGSNHRCEERGDHR